MKEYNEIKINPNNPEYINAFSTALLDGFYMREGESVSEALARPAYAYCYGDFELAQRINDYAHKGWFMYASPVLSNAPKGNWVADPTKEGAHYWYKHTFIPSEKVVGQPISCFAMDIPDTAQGQVAKIQELADLSMSGGGIGTHMSIRGVSKKANGVIPYEKLCDSAIGYFKQNSTRKGAVAAYLDVDHPDIIEHIRFRTAGGDTKRRSDNRQQYHVAVNVTDDFINAVLNDLEYDLVCPHSKKVHDTLNARKVWEEILETRALTGEPYLLKIDAANRRLPATQKAKGLKIKGSNLCSEILMPTSDERTFVCCLSSLNIEKFDEWKDTTIVEDLIRFLDNVLQSFIDNAPDSLKAAKYSAEQERGLGLGTLGLHSYLQSKSIPFESGGFGSAVQAVNQIYGLISKRAEAESRKLAVERGEPADMIGSGLRNSQLTALAPNANSADVIGTSPSKEPMFRNVFLKATRAGNFQVRNKQLEKVLEALGKNIPEVWEDIGKNEGSVQHLDFLSEHEKKVFKVAMEIDQHWVVELADHIGKYVTQAQSTNLFFPFGVDRSYVNSVHLKFLKSENVHTLYYYRTEREGKADNVKSIERKALVDWKPQEGECLSCQG